MSELDAEAIAAILEQPLSNGSFERDHLRQLRQLGRSRPAVLLAFPPKAAGTFLRTAIIRAIDGQLVRICHAQGGRDATPYLPTLVQYYSGGITDKTLVAHAHMLALPANLYLLAAFGIRPIVIIRNVPDMLASYWDMLADDNNALLDGLNCIIPPNFRDMPRHSKADFVIDVLGPWYANYYAGWLSYAQEAPDSVCLVDYRILKNDPVGVLEQCLDKIGLPQSRVSCEMAVLQTWNQRRELRFNKGIEGRGEDYFRQAQLHRLVRIFGHYPVLTPYRAQLLENPRVVQPLRRRAARA